MLHVGRPNILNRAKFLERVESILDSKILTNDGPMVRELESSFCELFNVAHCLAFSNATLAIELLVKELDITGEVIVPSFTFVATAHAVKTAGAQPVFCDVEAGSDSGLMCPELAEKLINEKTQAIMPVNVYGNICNLEAFEALAQKHKLQLIYDSAHAIGCSYRGRRLGSFGRAEVFSLHATKFINAFEGGLIATNDGELATRLKLARNFGFATYDTVVALGTNAKLSEIHAAMGLTNLECMEEIVNKNRENYELYSRHLPKQFKLLQFASHIEPNYQYVVVFCPDGLRDRAVDVLKQNDVFARRYFFPGIHRHAPYDQESWDLPNTDRLASNVICLPTGQDISETDIARICSILKDLSTPSDGEGSKAVALAGQ
jgi:dTDP-4-amino-4,6-dideoxygalactose transaminase